MDGSGGTTTKGKHVVGHRRQKIIGYRVVKKLFSAQDEFVVESTAIWNDRNSTWLHSISIFEKPIWSWGPHLFNFALRCSSRSIVIAWIAVWKSALVVLIFSLRARFWDLLGGEGPIRAAEDFEGFGKDRGSSQYNSSCNLFKFSGDTECWQCH